MTTTSPPPRHHLGYHQKANEIKDVTTSTTYNNSSWESDSFQDKYPLLGPLGKEVVGGNREGLAQPGEGPKMALRSRLVGCSSGSGIPNSMGQRVGEDNPAAKLTQVKVDAIRDRYEAGQRGEQPRIGYKALAKAYEVSKGTIKRIVTYQTWAAYPTRWKRVKVAG